jgi:GNAT superfamily N-acetyltransferase
MDDRRWTMPRTEIRAATPQDVPLILSFIRELAEYERLSHEVCASEDMLRASLFGERAVAEVVLANLDGEPVGFAVFFPSYSTFLGRPGLYLEDLFIRPAARGFGLGRQLLEYLARLTIERGWGRLEWRVLDWNAPSIAFYKRLGAEPLDDWTVFRVTGDNLRNLAGGSA